MEKTATNIYDRSGWGSGPWDDEPDRVEWRELGFVCLALRSGTSGAWCGYVGVPEGHPWHGKHDLVFDCIDNIDVHGGVTYTAPCRSKIVDGEEQGICHAPEPGEADALFWVGFDCSHYGDKAPVSYFGDGEYRDLAFVRAEVSSLARQAGEVASCRERRGRVMDEKNRSRIGQALLHLRDALVQLEALDPGVANDAIARVAVVIGEASIVLAMQAHAADEPLA